MPQRRSSRWLVYVIAAIGALIVLGLGAGSALFAS